MVETTVIQIISLAFVNAINPCALASLVLVLITILLANENKRYKVLLGGFSFVLAVFIGYFIYGVVIIKLFQNFSQFASVVTPYIRNGLAIFAIGLGILNIKDYLYYKPGGFATEMPLRFRPRMKLVVKKITGPTGAFFAGIFVTLFLLPCTMGPYIIASGNLASMEFIKTIPYLLLYNLIFVLPMILITIGVYYGLSSAEKVGEWRDRNIKFIHLIAGLVLVLLGILMITKII
jgi:cytochrome c biogenesis protein CcdA